MVTDGVVRGECHESPTDTGDAASGWKGEVVDSMVEGALSWAPMQRRDLVSVAELRQAIDYLDDSIDGFDLPAFEERFERMGESPSPDAVVGRDVGGTIVAYGWNVVRRPAGQLPQVWLDGGVHPGWRHHKIGRRIVRWQLERAEEWLRTAVDTAGAASDPSAIRAAWVGTYVDEKVRSRSHVLTDAGLLPERWYQDLHATLCRGDLRAPEALIDTRRGPVVIAPYQAGHSEQVRRLHNEVFGRLAAGTTVAPASVRTENQDLPGALMTGESIDAQTWEASWERPAARPDWSWVALCEGQVVGYALNSECPPDPDGLREGWTDRLGVGFSWRGIGVGTALLRSSRHSFALAGMDQAGAGIDTIDPERTLRALHAAGYEEADTVALYSARLELDAAGLARWEAPGRLG